MPDCPKCAATLARRPDRNHLESQSCRRGAVARELVQKAQGELPQVWRWILAPLGIPIELVEAPVKTESRRAREARLVSSTTIRVPDWVADVVTSFGGAPRHTAASGYVLMAATVDAAAARALPFISVCLKSPQLIAAFRAATKLGGPEAAQTFATDPDLYVRMFAGKAK